MKKIPENVIIVIKAVAPLFVVIILFFILINVGLSKVSNILSQISEAKNDNLVLTEKLGLLRKVSVTGTNDSNVVMASLPETSPALIVVSQLRNLAAGNGLILSSVKVNPDSENSTDIKNVAIDFSISGQKDAVNAFLLNLSTLAPISILNKLKMSELDGVFEADITLNSYWSSLPSELPATLEGFEDLSQDEVEILTIVSNLTQPTFSDLPAMEGSGKENPFTR